MVHDLIWATLDQYVLFTWVCFISVNIDSLSHKQLNWLLFCASRCGSSERRLNLLLDALISTCLYIYQAGLAGKDANIFIMIFTLLTASEMTLFGRGWRFFPRLIFDFRHLGFGASVEDCAVELNWALLFEYSQHGLHLSQEWMPHTVSFTKLLQRRFVSVKPLVQRITCPVNQSSKWGQDRQKCLNSFGYVV